MAILRNLGTSIHRLAGPTGIAAVSRFYNRGPNSPLKSPDFEKA
ncbi:hypothetical protein [Brevibacterium aurantiacum]|nr:hypothetical protein [Brevibacterium aurantiacum]